MNTDLTPTDAFVELQLLSTRLDDDDRDRFFVTLVNSDIPMEIITRLNALWDVTKEVGGRIVRIGKLIVAELIRFVSEFPHFSIGMAIGAVLHSLLAAVPFIGPVLAPLAVAMGASIGFRLDTGKPVSDSVEGLAVHTFSDIVAMAKTFLEWFVGLLSKVFSDA
ncbi:MAG: hypothetical protein Hals2KO_19380 [Halioglobus sp.]